MWTRIYVKFIRTLFRGGYVLFSEWKMTVRRNLCTENYDKARNVL